MLRKTFVKQKLQKFNNTDQLADIINKAFHPTNLLTNEIPIEKLITEANDIFAYDGLKIAKTERGRRIISLTTSTQIVETENGSFQKEMFRLFISHKDDNKQVANKLKKALEVFGITCFVAHEDIEPSTEWQKEIEKELFSMDALLALLSDGFSKSVWTNQEVGVAFGRDVFILSIKCGEDPKGFVGKFQALRPKNTDINDLATQIAEQLIKEWKTSKKIKFSYIHALSCTSQYEDTERWAKLLPHIDSLSEEQAQNLFENYNSNSQAYDCYALNGGKYGNGKNIADYLNEWTKNIQYIITNGKLEKITND